ncbi:formylglycine-generating enzyme family protein [Mongoliibacter ruber]|uniref:Formylglycine-generating enzyme required for sulfatase activity n=1 Tax=Mongoliibacter ruber TaxID=1750599 RepID=A0A2T0WCY3_9BACT|nr:formylglycine-generating enzyme family protein [Mongoliibacter ruber]PRY84560.1 formylglycine-generating enzyme required for sulfatase activity [Mongoliibacter ruber]
MKTFMMAVLAFLVVTNTTAQEKSMALVDGGNYTPLYGVGEQADAEVLEFYLDINPVSYSDFQLFVQQNPEWQKSKVKKIFADSRYLSNWENDTQAPTDLLDKPVTMISWFAAKAYCECQGKRLPTVDEWEFAAMASASKKDAREDSLYNVSILRSYEQPKTYLKTVGLSPANYWGIKDLHGMVWEWTQDFNSIILTGESRNNGNTDAGLFCAAGAIGAKDMMNYAAFMRYAMRSSIKANYAITTIGFRCAKDALPQKHITSK